MSKRRNFFMNTALMVFSVLVCLAVLEVIVKVSVPTWYPRYAFSPDPVLGYVNSPDSSYHLKSTEFNIAVQHSSDGFRTGTGLASKGGKGKIFGIGDSFCWGFGVKEEENLLQVLAQKTGYETSNGCVCGYGTLQALSMLKIKGGKVKPDIVLLSFFLGNDFYENIGVRRTTVIDGWLYEEPSESSSLFFKTVVWLKGNSRLVNLVVNKIKGSSYYLWLKKEGYISGEVIDEFDLYNTAGESLRFERAFSITEELLKELKEETEKMGARLAVLIIPTKNQVNPSSFMSELQKLNLPPEDFDLDRPHNRLIASLNKLEIPHINVLESLRKSLADGKDPYFIKDRHWNKTGHAIAGTAVSKALTALEESRKPNKQHR